MGNHTFYIQFLDDCDDDGIATWTMNSYKVRNFALIKVVAVTLHWVGALPWNWVKLTPPIQCSLHRRHRSFRLNCLLGIQGQTKGEFLQESSRSVRAANRDRVRVRTKLERQIECPIRSQAGFLAATLSRAKEGIKGDFLATSSSWTYIIGYIAKDIDKHNWAQIRRHAVGKTITTNGCCTLQFWALSRIACPIS